MKESMLKIPFPWWILSTSLVCKFLLILLYKTVLIWSNCYLLSSSQTIESSLMRESAFSNSLILISPVQSLLNPLTKIAIWVLLLVCSIIWMIISMIYSRYVLKNPLSFNWITITMMSWKCLWIFSLRFLTVLIYSSIVELGLSGMLISSFILSNSTIMLSILVFNFFFLY